MGKLPVGNSFKEINLFSKKKYSETHKTVKLVKMKNNNSVKCIIYSVTQTHFLIKIIFKLTFIYLLFNNIKYTKDGLNIVFIFHSFIDPVDKQ